jgi:hypothetical protein
VKPICIACGCDERHACPVNLLDAGAAFRGCFWLRFDSAAGLGVCSECADLVKIWDQAPKKPPAPIPALIAERYYRQVLFLYVERADALAWLNSPQQLLHNKSPRDLILAGELERVRALVDLIASGAFA